MGNLKMWMSTKPYSKLFNVVQNNILSTFQIIAKIYDDRIRPKCPENFENLRKMKTWKCKYTKPWYTFQCDTTTFYECSK